MLIGLSAPCIDAEGHLGEAETYQRLRRSPGKADGEIRLRQA
jgi:hypothetical protein